MATGSQRMKLFSAPFYSIQESRRIASPEAFHEESDGVALLVRRLPPRWRFVLSPALSCLRLLFFKRESCRSREDILSRLPWVTRDTVARIS